MSVDVSIGETKAVTVKVGEKVCIKGDPGFSPIVEIEEIPRGHRITIISEGGSQSFDVMDGDGKGITSTVLNPNYTLTIFYTDGTSWTSSSIRGETGPQGPQGPKGDTGEVSQEEFDALAEIVDRKAGMLVDTVSGAIASFVPDSTVPNLLGVSVAVEPQQDLHGYDSPWPGGGGKNKLPLTATTKTISGVTFSVNSDGTINVSGTANAQIIFNVGEHTATEAETVVINGISGGSITTYSINCAKNGQFNYSDVFGGDSGNISLAANDVLRYVIVVRSGAAVSFVCKPMIRLASVTDATFAPYENLCPISGWDAVEVNHSGADTSDPTTYTITLGQTVYGGTLDATAGTLTVDRVCTTESSSTGWTVNTGEERAFKQFDIKTYADSNTPSPYVKTNYLPTISFERGYTSKDQGVFIGANSKNVCVHIDGATDVSAAAFNSYLSEHPLQICYTLATPITIQLDPVTISTISGQTNNVWADAGNVSVEYAADIKAYIDRLNQSPEDDMIANTLIAANKYFTVNNRLFLSTASIAAGAQIIPGTNCTETSLAAALNALNA